MSDYEKLHARIAQLVVRNSQLGRELECALGDISTAKGIIERLTSKSELYEQVERAAGCLPTGWEIRVCVEKDCGYAELWDADGCEVDYPNSCETLALSVSDAIDCAISQES
jgi:hypothetical protein